jgi:hypothetical protein
MITLPPEIKARYKPASLPTSQPANQSFEDWILTVMDEADAVAEAYPVTYSHEEVFGPLRGRYTKNRKE